MNHRKPPKYPRLIFDDPLAFANMRAIFGDENGGVVVAFTLVPVREEDNDISTEIENEDSFFGVRGHSVVAMEVEGGKDEGVVEKFLVRMGLMRETVFVEVSKQ